MGGGGGYQKDLVYRAARAAVWREITQSPWNTPGAAEFIPGDEGLFRRDVNRKRVFSKVDVA